MKKKFVKSSNTTSTVLECVQCLKKKANTETLIKKYQPKGFDFTIQVCNYMWEAKSGAGLVSMMSFEYTYTVIVIFKNKGLYMKFTCKKV